jgi:hypothetical protein
MRRKDVIEGSREALCGLTIASAVPLPKPPLQAEIMMEAVTEARQQRPFCPLPARQIPDAVYLSGQPADTKMKVHNEII